MNDYNPLIFVGLAVGVLMLSKKSSVSYSENEKVYRPLIDAASKKYGIPDGLLYRLIKTESAFNPNAVNPKSGALGLAQIMLRWHPNVTREQALNPNFAIDYAGKYLAELYKTTKDWRLAVAAYNWGIGNLQKQGIVKAPLETVNYIKKVYG